MKVFLVCDGIGRVVPLVFGSLTGAKDFVFSEEGADFEPVWFESTGGGLWLEKVSGCSILERTVITQP